MKYTDSFTQNNQIQFPMSTTSGTQCCQKGQRLNGYKTNSISLLYVFPKQKEHTLS